MSTPSADRSATATAAATTTDPAGPGTALHALRVLGDQVASSVDHVRQDSWHAASPCPDLDVGALVAHLIGGLRAFTAVARGEDMPGFASPEVAAGDAARAFRGALDAAVDAWSVPGRLARSHDMPWGPTTGEQLVGFLVIEQAGHGWDLARALGIGWNPDAEAVTVADAVARAMMGPQMRAPGMFGPEVPAPPDAAPIDRLAAFLGRHP